MKSNTIQTNFTAGEVSPYLYGRSDLAKFFNGARKIQNFIVRPQGGIIRRSGTRYVNGTKTNTKKSRLIPFVFSNVQSYILEFGDFYMRVYKDGGIVESSPGVPVEVVTPWGENDLPDLYVTQSADVLYVAHPLYQTRKISRTSHTSWSISLYAPVDGPYLDIDKSGVTMRLSGISDVVTLKAAVGAPGFVAGDIGKYIDYRYNNEWKLAVIKTIVSGTEVTADYLTNVIHLDPELKAWFTSDPNIDSDRASAFKQTDEKKYVRAEFAANSGNFQWRKTSFLITGDGSRMRVGSAVTLAGCYGATGTIYPTIILDQKSRVISATLTASAATFASTDVNRYIRLHYGALWINAKITAYTSTTVVTVTLSDNLPLDNELPDQIYANGLADEWRLGAWSTTTGWPAIVAFHKQRLFFAKTSTQPQTFWGTVTGDYENMAPTDPDGAVLDDSSIVYTLASNRVSPIMWLDTGPVMLIGAMGGEWQVKPASITEGLTPKNIEAIEHTSFGSTQTARPMRIGVGTLFTQRGGKKIRELTYSFEIDALLAKDVSILSEHLLGRKVVTCAYQKEPVIVAWFCMSDGTLLGLTYEKDNEVFAWHQHAVGGDGFIESIAVVPSTDGDNDNLYMIVKRTINGSTKRYVERVEVEFSGTLEDMFFVECGLTYSGAAATTISGLSHLEGQTVDVVADGVYIGTKVVSSGSFTLSTAASKVHAGIPSSATLTTLDVEGGSPIGTSQGKTKRIDKLTVRVRNSLWFKHGPSESSLDDTPEKFVVVTSDDIRVSLNQTYQLTGGYTIKQTLPYPLTILALMPAQNTNE